MLAINNLVMSYGAEVLFSGVSLNLVARQRYGIVGANGSGKSTFLRLLAGEEQPSGGSIEIANKGKIGFLKQDHYKYEQELILNVVLQGNAKLWQALQTKEKLLAQAELSVTDGMQLAECEQVIFDHDGYTAETTCAHILEGLGISEDKHYEPMTALSGGFKLRVLLAQVLFSNPEILLLDEPTNHLDIAAIRWLENYLSNDYKGVLLIVSHDHNFLNNLTTNILDVDYGTITSYSGNYDSFVQAKTQTASQQEIERLAQEREIAKMQAFVDKFKAKASKASQAQSRVKMIDKISLTEVAISSRKAPNFDFGIKRQSGKEVLRVKNIDKSYDGKQVLAKVNFAVNRGEKVGIIGQNGIGKSTLLKVLLGIIPAESAEFAWGYEAQRGYFSQDHHEVLHEKMSIYNWLLDNASQDVDDKAVRSMLGRMLFSQDAAHKLLPNLSGGEAARVLFANLQLARSNVLVLDEPTNHLDLESIDALAAALAKFTGTLIVVSHDRGFLNKACDRIIVLEHAKIYDYQLTHGLTLETICDRHFAA